MQLRVRQTPLDLLVFLLAGLLVLAMVGLFWAKSWDKTVAMAKKEGKLVVVLGGGASRRYRPVFKFFENKFGIRTRSPQVAGASSGIGSWPSAAPAITRSTSSWSDPPVGTDGLYPRVSSTP